MGLKIIDLLPTLPELEKHEKLFIIQFLVSELSREEEKLLTPKADYPVWSPYESQGAAAVLLKMLEDESK